MQGNPRIVGLLNELLTLELTVINQYFVHSKMCENWGYKRLASAIRGQAMAEMKDAEEITERILYLDGVPNLQRLGSVVVGETVTEQLRLQLDAEKKAVDMLSSMVAACVDEGDYGTREFLAPRIAEEEGHIDWLETQLSLIEKLGENDYLAQQIGG